ncbi:BTAD domain-containing putative transcriptional regulator [Streptomyces sp. NPDC048604]|uniref:AfsR/SARP family transcriptional regulator n=1 Tax=Streptomyces sp. NPDC048604 TaxID=3365578 RepID=UPI0037210DAE
MPSPSAPPSGALRFSLLGPLAVHRGDRAVPLGPLKQRIVLATLLGSPGRPVTVDALTDAVWPDEPPRTARKNLQVYVSALRTLLAEDGGRPRIGHSCGGYVLRVAEDELDVLRFRALVRAAEGQPPREAARLLREALDLWQGPPFGDLRQSPRLADEAERLELRRLTAYENWAEAALELGGAPAVVEELRDLVEEHPLRERLRSCWMQALSRSGRLAEALAEYDDYRQLLARELGLEPGGAMTARYRSILTGTEPPARGLPAPAGAPGPAPLPSGVVDFAGRCEELRELLDLLEDETAAGVILLSGPAGEGKTALAVRAAHLLADRFPDGRYFLSLRRAAPSAPEAWRQWLAGHRALVVLDDVPDESAVRPLLPGTGRSRVLLTARGQLGGLAPVHRIAVPPLGGREALELLGGLIGHGRVRADQEAARRIVRACGGSPLAVRVSGMRLAVLRHVPLREFADRLADPAGALDELTAGDVSVRRRLARGWAALPASCGRDAALLAAGTGDGPFGLSEAALALGCDERHAVRVVESLIGAGVVVLPGGEVTAHAAQYELPPLVRLYAREASRTEPVLIPG